MLCRHLESFVVTVLLHWLVLSKVLQTKKEEQRILFSSFFPLSCCCEELLLRCAEGDLQVVNNALKERDFYKRDLGAQCDACISGRVIRADPTSF